MERTGDGLDDDLKYKIYDNRMAALKQRKEKRIFLHKLIEECDIACVKIEKNDGEELYRCSAPSNMGLVYEMVITPVGGLVIRYEATEENPRINDYMMSHITHVPIKLNNGGESFEIKIIVPENHISGHSYVTRWPHTDAREKKYLN